VVSTKAVDEKMPSGQRNGATRTMMRPDYAVHRHSMLFGHHRPKASIAPTFLLRRNDVAVSTKAADEKCRMLTELSASLQAKNFRSIKRKDWFLFIAPIQWIGKLISINIQTTPITYLSSSKASSACSGQGRG
jgi:hypothetical protein